MVCLDNQISLYDVKEWGIFNFTLVKLECNIYLLNEANCVFLLYIENLEVSLFVL